jgi:nucleoside 2-deoxyribosyltransferase
MNIYVASHCRWAGLHVALVLEDEGFRIVSRWLDQEFKPTDQFTEATRRDIAVQDTLDVLACDALVLVAGPDRYPGGKFVEAGIAIGAGKRVIVIGRRENMLLWHPDIEQVETPQQAASALSSPVL